jgi:hypothetical protein
MSRATATSPRAGTESTGSADSTSRGDVLRPGAKQTRLTHSKETIMPTDAMYHPTTPEIAARRKELAPHTHEAFEAFSRAVFADGALSEQNS